MYASLRACVNDLEKHGQLLRIPFEVDPNLEMAEIHHRVFEKQGPAILFEKVKGSKFQAVSNIYGTFERTDFLFRKTLDKVKKVTELKADPTAFLRNPGRYISAPFTALKALPRKTKFRSASTYAECSISDLPLVKSWPEDGGAFVTMPQVMTLPPDSRKIMKSNLGMYRIQLDGNEYITDQEIGLHYQLHRGIGVHHKAYNDSEKPFLASVFIGGPPSHAFSAIMPMPEGLSELTFAGMLADRRFRYHFDSLGNVISNDADFVITGEIIKDYKKPEGPFGDHLGYYSLTHDFPVMKVHKVYHRKDALWHFSVVGRPPMEDSSFGYLIHKLVEALTPGEFPGLKSINAVDAAGVHPLLLAVGQERYMPFRDQKPEEILTIANRILGSGQTSLAKFLWIAAEEDGLNADNIEGFFDHCLARIDWSKDVHFQTNTTIDTLDYSGDGWNAGSKVVIACNRPPQRKLGTRIPENFNLSSSWSSAKMVRPGVLALSGLPFTDYENAIQEMKLLTEELERLSLEGIAMIIVCDEAEFTAATLNNFLWVSFTRANPSHDIYGVNAFTKFKHWGCDGPLIIDARIKPFHAPPLISDPQVSKKVDAYFSKGGALYQAI